MELGTGTGLSACWLLDGMDQHLKLVTVDNDHNVVEIAKKYLSCDHRIEFHIQDASEFLTSHQEKKYDFIFADAWPGKFCNLNEALDLLCQGGVYVIDDLLPQKSWPDHHQSNVDKLIGNYILDFAK